LGKAVQYRKQSLADRLFQGPQQGAQTLEAAIKEIFPKADLVALKRWAARVRAETPVEPELLLFATLLCGVRFQIVHSELKPTLEGLWNWLTGHPRNMSGELAELVIEALTPGLQRAIDDRGWKKGHDGPYVKKKGTPPVGRGAWTAVLLTEHYLRTIGTTKGVMAFAVGLASAILGRRVEPTQAYRMRGRIKNNALEWLAHEVRTYYEFSIEQDGARDRDFRPTADVQTNVQLWREKHRGLSHLLANFGGQDWAGLILRKIQPVAWEPFWDLKSDEPRARPKPSA
jgi:hypothetical protein